MTGIDSMHIYRQMLAVIQLAKKAYRPYTRQIGILTALSFIGGILGGIGINAIIPLLTFMLGLQNPATDMISTAIKSFFDFARVPFVPKYLLTFVVILFIGQAAVNFVISYIQIRITTQYERDTRAKLFSKVLWSSWPYLLRQRLGNLETLLMVDTPAAMNLLVKLSFAITVLATLLMYLVVAFSISALVTSVTFILGILTFVLLRPLLDRVHNVSRNRTVVYRDILHHVTEHVGGLKTVKAFGVEKDAISKGETLFSNIRDYSTRIQVLQQLAIQALNPIGVLYIAGILALAFKTPFISLAALPSILYLIYRIFTYIQQLQTTVQYMSELAPHLERVVLYEGEAEAGAAVDAGTRFFSFDRNLMFDHVTFAYDGSKAVLKDISFDIKKGSMVGIVGPSGAGKTTTVDLMLRLLEPTEGDILLDGIGIEEISLEAWRRNIAYVSQDPFLIQDTIRNNIRFYDDSVSDEEIMDAAKMARIDGFIKKAPEGLDTMVGERGIRLSAGERQRITIARALARKPQLLILDEATSALDNESEAHIKEVIGSLKGKLTIIAIAHRLSTIMDSDSLVVLSDGNVVETGTPQDLLKNQDSYFYKVYTISQ